MLSRFSPSRTRPCCGRGLLAALFAISALQAPALQAVQDITLSGDYQRESLPALGIDDTFGRWTGTVRLVYDPDGAPSRFSNNTQFLALLERAYQQWERVSGVRFVISGVDANAPNDRNLPNSQQDGLVRVFWGTAGGAAGLAGPSFGNYDTNLGYFPFDDGSLELNNGANVIDSDYELIGVLVHELGHVLGLGHSDNPQSIMYANPYNHLQYPRTDDIRAMQVLYGVPTTAINPDNPLSDWLYVKPAAAPSSLTQSLFVPNASFNESARFIVGGSTVTSVTTSTPSGQFVSFSPGGFKGANGAALALDLTVVVVDPFGYANDFIDWSLNCPASFNCGGGSIGVAQTHALKVYPGTWKVYIVNKNPAAGQGSLLLEMSLPVTTSGTYNLGPTATLTAVAGSTNTQATFTLTATDPESNGILVVWRPPGANDLDGNNVIDVDARNTFASGGSAQRTFNFGLAGTHTFFVEVRDNAARYNGSAADSSVAGDGFQTLLKVTITVPVTSSASLQVVSTQASISSSPSQSTLSAVAKTAANPQQILTQNVLTGVRSTTTATFQFGASKDQGVTTATTFNAGDSVIIAGGVTPQTVDIGKSAQVYIVIRTTTATTDSWTYRNASGVYVPWTDLKIASLQPASTVSSLASSQAFEIHNGSLVAAQHRIYIGYKPAGSDLLHFTGQAHSLTVN